MTRRDVDPSDVQALARSGLNSLPEAAYLLLRVKDTAGARRYLAERPPTAMSDLTGSAPSNPCGARFRSPSPPAASERSASRRRR